MKNIIFFVLLLTATICQGQTNEQKSSIAVREVVFEKDKKDQCLKIDFLDKKYQKNGYSVNDDINGNLYPSYSYYDKKIGSFSVNYISKSLIKQNFWNVDNKKGFFSKYKNPEDGSHDSKNILKYLNPSDYYIIVEYLPSKYIKFIGGTDEEFDVKANAMTQFYLYENKQWINLGTIETKKIPEKEYQYYITLIQDHNKDRELPVLYLGNFSTSVNTESTTTGMANITYNFKSTLKNIILTENTYHEPIICEGAYGAVKEENILKLYYLGSDMDCVSIEPKFRIKYEKDKYYIKGIGSLSTSDEWIELIKK